MTFEELATLLQTELKAELLQQGHSATGNLINSVEVKYFAGEFKIVCTSEPYGQYVERGRKKKAKLIPLEFLEIIKPDVHVNGSDYGEDCIEKETVERNNGRIHIVELLNGYSSTNIITNGTVNPDLLKADI